MPMTLTAVALVVKHLDLEEHGLTRKLINEFVDSASSVSIERASLLGFPRLLERVASARQSVIDAHYLAHVWNLGVDRAAASGDLVLIEEFVVHFPGIVIINAPVVAAQHQQRHVLEWLAHRGPLVVWNDKAFHAALVSLATLRWFAARFDLTRDQWLLHDAIERSDDDVVQFLWFLYNNSPRHVGLLGAAISRAPLRLARWMVENTAESIMVSLDDAAASGDLEYVIWAAANAYPNMTVDVCLRAMDRAVADGHTPVVRWFHHHTPFECSTDAMDEACSNGHVDVVMYLYEDRHLKCSARALYGAAVGGHLDMFKWLQRTFENLDCPEDTFDDTCANGHIAMARYLDAWGIGGGTASAMDLASAAGHLDMVKWLSEIREAECTTAAIDAAATGGHTEVVEWLHKHRTEGATTAAMDGAAANGHMELVVWLRTYRPEGCSQEAMTWAARSGSMEMVAWLHDKYPLVCSQPAIDDAVMSGNVELVKWFAEERREMPSNSAMEVAATNEGDHFRMCELLRFLHAAPPTGYAFEVNMDAGNLNLAAWIATNFPGVADINYVMRHRDTTHWNSDVLRVMFNI